MQMSDTLSETKQKKQTALMGVEPELFEPTQRRCCFDVVGEGGYSPRHVALIRNLRNPVVLTLVCDTFISEQNLFIVRPMGCGGHGITFLSKSMLAK